MLPLLLKGLVAGALCALPLGPMGLLCLERTLRHGRKVGLLSAAGIASAQALWCLALALGSHAFSGVASAHEGPFRIGVGILLCVVGGNGWRKAGHERQTRASRHTTLGGFMANLAVVGGNPVTSITLIAVFAGLGVLGGELGVLHSIELAGAVFLGAMMMWFVLTGFLARLREWGGEEAGRQLGRGLSAGLLFIGIAGIVAGAWGL